MKLGKVALMAAVALAGMTCSATRYFKTNGGDITVGDNWTGSGNVYFQSGYNSTVESGYLSEGTFSSDVIIYIYRDTSKGTAPFTLNISGGTFNANFKNKTGASNPSLTLGNAVINQTGGVVNAGPANPETDTRTLLLAYTTDGHAQYNLSGGTLNVRGDSLLLVRSSSTATFNQTGGTLDTSGGKGQAVILGDAGTATATVNLSGGTAKVGRFYSKINTTSYLNFDGGTVQPLAASDEFIGSKTDSKGLTANVLAGGAIFYTAYDISSCLPLLSGAATDGGVTKKGEGVLTLAAGNTYNGPTKIEAGAVKIAKDATFTGSLTVAKGAQLLIAGVTSADSGKVVATFNGGITLAAGVDPGAAFASDADPFVTFEVTDGGTKLTARIPAENPQKLTASLDRTHCDYTNLTGTIDLNGNNFAIRFVDNVATSTATITDTSAAGSGGNLTLFVPAGVTSTNATMTLTGSLKVVKGGAGTLLMSKQYKDSAGHTGGTLVAAGTLMPGAEGAKYPLGVRDTQVTVDAGATFEANGYYRFHVYDFVLNGGTFASTVVLRDSKKYESDSQFKGLTLTADSSLQIGTRYGIVNLDKAETTIDLGGHKLSVDIGIGIYFALVNTTIKNGTMEYASGGYFYPCDGSYDVKFENATFVQKSGALWVGSKSVQFDNYTVSYNDNYGAGPAAMTLKGVFTPLTDRFAGCEMQDGSTLCLTNRTGVWTAYSSITKGIKRDVTFADNATIKVDLTGRTFETGEQIVKWQNVPVNITTLKFVTTDEEPVTLAASDKGIFYGADPESKEVATAVWKGADYADVMAPANWTCRNLAGVEIPGATPTAQSLNVFNNVELPDNCDWRALPCFSGTIDLKGRTLYVSSLAGTGTITNSVEDVGELHLDMAADAAAAGTKFDLVGNLKFVKAGAGTFTSTKAQTYTGGTEIGGGTWKTTACTESHFGGITDGSDKRVVRIASGATLDFNGKSGNAYPGTLFVLAGGSIVNNGGDIGNDRQGVGEYGGVPHLVNVMLEADSTIGGNTMPFLSNGYGTNYLDMGGCKLTVAMNKGKRLYLCNTQVSNGGTIEVTGGYLVIGGYTSDASEKKIDIHMPATSLVQGEGAGVRLLGNLEVLDYTCSATGDWEALSGTLTVNGAFKPVTDKFAKTVLNTNATLDVSAVAGSFAMASSIKNQGNVAVLSSVTVETGARELAEGQQILNWGTDTSYGDKIFNPCATMVAGKWGFEKGTDGLYVRSTAVPYYATRDVSTEPHTWKFFNQDGTPHTDWEGGLTEAIYVYFSSAAEYASIREAGQAGRGLVLTGGKLPDNDEPQEYDWTGMEFAMAEGVSFDVNGNVLVIPATLIANPLMGGRFTSTKAGGKVKCDVSDDTTNSSIGFGEGVTFVKEGEGTLVWAHNDTGANCLVAAGTLKGGVNNGLFAVITVEKGATFDFNGKQCDKGVDTSMKLVSNGGLLTSTTALNWNNATFAELEITDDTTVTVPVGSLDSGGGQCKGWGLNGGVKKAKLNGKTLTIQTAENCVFWFFGTKFENAGTVVHKGSGYVCFHDAVVDGSMITLKHNGGGFTYYGAVTVKLANYQANCTDTISYKDGTFAIGGIFSPNTDYYMNTKMLDGSTLDLAQRTTALSMTGTVSQGVTRHLTFDTGATVSVDVHGRAFTDEPTKVVAWDAVPSNVTFELSEASKNECCQIQVSDDGIYVTRKRGFMILLK